jgi:HAD superfamily hydrolase (TIGR01548 family)
MSKKLLIIFDMDGVLVDVTNSYREVTRRSVIEYLRRVLGADVSDHFITLADVASIKKIGGLNNDWDLTDAILNAYLFSAYDHIDEAMLRQLREVKSTGDDQVVFEQMRRMGLAGNTSKLEDLVRKQRAPALFSPVTWSKGDRSPFLLNQGDVRSGNLTKRIFQELYLGNDLFRQIYGEAPIFYCNGGYIERERMIPTLAQLDELSRSYTLSIATGRPGVEAEYALTQFSIGHYFKAMVSEDNVVEAEKGCIESLRKPHPFSLSLSVEKSGYTSNDSVYYVGDMPDDMVAAGRAQIHPIGFVNGDTDESEEQKHKHAVLLEHHGASGVFSHFNDLIAFLKER